MSASERLLSQIEALLPRGAGGLSAREVHRRLGMWAPTTIKNALLELAHRGRVEAVGDDRLRLYRKPRGQAA